MTTERTTSQIKPQVSRGAIYIKFKFQREKLNIIYYIKDIIYYIKERPQSPTRTF